MESPKHRIRLLAFGLGTVTSAPRSPIELIVTVSPRNSPRNPGIGDQKSSRSGRMKGKLMSMSMARTTKRGLGGRSTPTKRSRIDTSFVKREMLKAILSLAEKVKANVIAEGIETQEELKTLLELGITYGQGFLFARPEPGFVHQRSSEETAPATANRIASPSK